MVKNLRLRSFGSEEKNSDIKGVVLMYQNRLEEIKEIHEKANQAYESYESSSACADENTIKDSLSTLFYEEHTDWLIEQTEKLQKIEYEIDHSDMGTAIENIIRIIKE